MPETETNEQTPATGEVTPNAEPTPTPDEGALGDAGQKALKAERAARKKAEQATADALARVQEFEDAKKSDEEKAAERLANAEKSASEATARLARLEVAMEKGLPSALVDRLQGSTPEELAADADTLLALVKPADGSATPPSTGPLDGGAQPPEPTKSLDAQIAEASAAKDWPTVNALNAQKLRNLADKA